MLLRYKYTTFRHKARLQFCYFYSFRPHFFCPFLTTDLRQHRTMKAAVPCAGSGRAAAVPCAGSGRAAAVPCASSVRAAAAPCGGIALQILACTPVDKMGRLFRLHRCRVGHLYTEEIIPLTALLALPGRCFGFVHDENLVSAFTIQNCHDTSCFPAVVFLLSV